MGSIPRWLLVHSVDIAPYEGHSATGPVYGDPVTHRAFVEDRNRLVRNGQGEEVTSSTTVYLPPGTAVPTGSRVTTPARTSTALSVSIHDGGNLPTPDHVEVALE
ncbi:hypothetical protein [Actinopolyspora halophila]|uniref:hypothetical protein n=1 Tax=Actinopolyspora halophila TaxID=1850 RepID=UPI0003666CC3|nr:hypothetical protein [Actinopolyspora halophila]